MKKLFADLKKCAHSRKNYNIKFSVKFRVDRRRYYFSFIPTILYIPWIYAYPNMDGLVDIWWLNFHILIGRLEPKERDNNAA